MPRKRLSDQILNMHTLSRSMLPLPPPPLPPPPPQFCSGDIYNTHITKLASKLSTSNTVENTSDFEEDENFNECGDAEADEDLDSDQGIIFSKNFLLVLFLIHIEF